MPTAVLIVSHALSSESAQEAFRVLVRRVGARSGDCRVTGAYLDPTGADLMQAAEALLGAGDVTRLLLIPLFLHKAAHVTRDIPQMVQRIIGRYPGIHAEVLEGLWSEPLIEDALYERIASVTTEAADLPVLGAEIESRSHAIIDRALTFTPFTAKEKVVARRVIHATADFSFAHTLRFHPDAVEAGIRALRGRRPVICDVNMLRAGITRAAGVDLLCAVNEPEVIAAAKEKGCTRASAAVDHLRLLMDGSIVAVGNAPTAIWRLLELDVRPALVIGLPVGLVGARESKQALIASKHVFIANTTPRGGSPAAAAAVNALALLAQEVQADE